MIKVISTKTRLDAWLQATEYLMTEGEVLNLILEIESPCYDGPVGKSARESIDEFYASEDAFPLNTVAETIFPAWEYKHNGLKGMFKNYLAEYDELRKNDAHRWGTYAERLMRRRTGTDKVVNPLEELIKKMKSEAQQTNKGSFRSCYELGVAESEFDLPLYKMATDGARRRGGPCLAHLSFKLVDKQVHLTAIYRSHDYRYKVPGNLLGLARLQDCVAREVGVSVGSLVVHSTYAYVEAGKGKTKMSALITKLKKEMTKGKSK